jgi:hypothetical protein
MQVSLDAWGHELGEAGAQHHGAPSSSSTTAYSSASYVPPPPVLPSHTTDPSNLSVDNANEQGGPAEDAGGTGQGVSPLGQGLPRRQGHRVRSGQQPPDLRHLPSVDIVVVIVVIVFVFVTQVASAAIVPADGAEPGKAERGRPKL